ncbi:MAG: signal peptidase II [Paracoccaceae bacterium]
MRLAALTALATLVLDQASKLGVLFGLNLEQRGEIDVFPPFLVFRMAWNRGINFGLFSGEAQFTRWLLVIVALAISTWVWLWVRREGARPLAQVSAGLLVGGALGNVIDRLAYGAVADFLNMSCCGIENPYAFNVADIAVFAGALGLVLFSGSSSTHGGRGRQKVGKAARKTP